MAHTGARIVEASIVGTCVFVAIAVGILVAPTTIAPKPLEKALPATATALQESVNNLSSLLDQVDDKISTDMGTGADPADDSAPAGAQAYAATWLAADDGAVTGVRDEETQCRTLLGTATDALDPGKTLVGTSDQVDSSSVPQIVSLEWAGDLPATLDDCASQMSLSFTTMDDALASAKETAANQAATAAYASQIDALQTAIDAADNALKANQSATAGDARTALSAQRDAAMALVEAAQPADWRDLDAKTADLVQATQSLTDATSALKPAHVYTGKNGDLDPATLCSVPYDTKQLLRCDAEAAWMRLNAEYKSVWGQDIPIDLSYRTYDEQVEMRQIYGSGAAVPGTSNHGWATAIDLPDYRLTDEGKEWNYGTPKYEWMKANAPAYGWVNPAWAVQGGSGPHEPWHFEYHG